MLQHDGATRAATRDDLVPGAVLRRIESDGTSINPFADCVVLKVHDGEHWRTQPPATYVKLARPYVFVSSPGICSTPLVGCETFDGHVDSILQRYSVVLMSTGEPARYTT